MLRMEAENPMSEQPATPPSSSGEPQRTLSINLEQSGYDALARAAGERDLQPAELVSHWVRERLAHEQERRLGRARPQRPAGEP